MCVPKVQQTSFYPCLGNECNNLQKRIVYEITSEKFKRELDHGKTKVQDLTSEGACCDSVVYNHHHYYKL